MPLGGAVVTALGAPAAIDFTVRQGAGNGILTIAKDMLPLALFKPAGYGHRQGVLMVPARFAQALAPLAFTMLLLRLGRGPFSMQDHEHHKTSGQPDPGASKISRVRRLARRQPSPVRAKTS